MFRSLCGWALVFMAVAAAPLAGCRKPLPQQETPRRPKVYVIGVSLAAADTPWRAQMKADIETAAARHPNLRLMVLEARNDASKQQAHLEEFRDSHVDLVIINPKDTGALTDPVAQTVDAGIPVIVLDRPVVGSKYTCLIAADPSQIGEAAGKWMAKRLHGKGNIIEIRGPVDSQPAERIHAAWRKAFLDPGYHMVYAERVDPPKIDAATLLGEALKHVERFDALFAYDDAAAEAAYQVAQKAGRAKGAIFVGIGGLPNEGGVYVAKHTLDASFLYPTGGTEAIAAAIDILRGEKVQKQMVPPTRLISVAIETKPPKL
jgi:ribose transport system substrate-binding protein